MTLSEQMLIFFSNCDRSHFSSLLSGSQSFKGDFRNLVVLSANTGLLHDLLEEFELDDTHDKVSVILDFVTQTVVVNGICIITVFVEFEVHIDELETARSC